MVSLGVMTKILILLVTAVVGISVLLMEHVAEGVRVVIEDGMEGVKGVKVVARDDVEGLNLHHKRICMSYPKWT